MNEQPPPSPHPPGSPGAGRPRLGRVEPAWAKPFTMHFKRQDPGRKVVIAVAAVAMVVLVAVALVASGVFSPSRQEQLVGTWELIDAQPGTIDAQLEFGGDGRFLLTERRTTDRGPTALRLSGRWSAAGSGDRVELEVESPPERARKQVIAIRIADANRIIVRFDPAVVTAFTYRRR